MNYFTIKDIENITGIKAHTLRIWEQRYNILVPKRKESNHRYYDNEDLKSVLRISYLYHNGYKISKIVELSEEEIKRIALETVSGETVYSVLINQLMESSIDYDQDRFEQIIHSCISHYGFEKSMYEVIYPFLEKIGILWITDHMLPSQEHFATNLIRKKILVAIDGLGLVSKHGNESAVLLFLPEGERHEISLLMAKYHLRKHGKNTVYFGSDVPFENIIQLCGQKNISHLYCHLITNLTHIETGEYLKKLCEKFPDKTIVMSGPEALRLENAKLPNLKLIRSLDEFREFVATL